MNYDRPRQVDPAADRADAGKWRYTSMNDGHVWAIGYCSPRRTCPECRGASAASGVVPESEGACATCSGYGFIEVDDCPGHDTERGAREHHTEYLLAECLVLDAHLKAEKRKCVAPKCGEWTQGLAMIQPYGPDYVLCDAHRTRDVVADLFGVVGNITHS